MTAPLLALRQVCYSYGATGAFGIAPLSYTIDAHEHHHTDTLPKQALTNINLDIHQGEHLALLGANGSGKSTLARIIAQLAEPQSGTVETTLDPRSCAIVFQHPEDQLVTTIVEDEVAFGPEQLGVPSAEIARRVHQELARVSLTDFAGENPLNLSGGQQQRVAIAAALAQHPELIVLDEPTAALDMSARRSLMAVLQELKTSGATIVLVTHLLEEALQADRLVILDQGKIVLETTPDEVRNNPSLLEGLPLELPEATRLARALKLPAPWPLTRAEIIEALDGNVERRPQAPARALEIPTSTPTPTPTPSPLSQSPNKSTGKLLCFSNVGFSYGQRFALGNLSLSFKAHERHVILGASGSGKTTLARLAAALELPQKGQVELVDRGSSRAQQAQWWRHVGFLMQHAERQLFAESVEDDVAFGPSNLKWDKATIEHAVDEALEAVGLANKRALSPFALSGGEQRRAALAGVIAMKPQVIILDEPYAGLDAHARHELERIFNGLLDQGVALLEITHSLGAATRADALTILDQGRVALSGTPQEVFAPHNQTLLRRLGLDIPVSVEVAATLGLPTQPLSPDAFAAHYQLKDEVR